MDQAEEQLAQYRLKISGDRGFEEIVVVAMQKAAQDVKFASLAAIAVAACRVFSDNEQILNRGLAYAKLETCKTEAIGHELVRLVLQHIRPEETYEEDSDDELMASLESFAKKIDSKVANNVFGEEIEAKIKQKLKALKLIGRDVRLRRIASLGLFDIISKWIYSIVVIIIGTIALAVAEVF